MEVEGGVFHPGTLGHVSDEMFPSWAKDERRWRPRSRFVSVRSVEGREGKLLFFSRLIPLPRVPEAERMRELSLSMKRTLLAGSPGFLSLTL